RRGSRVAKSIFEVSRAPTRLESSEECPRSRKNAPDMDGGCRRREVRGVELGRYVLKVRVSIRAAIEPRISETGRIREVLASGAGRICSQTHKDRNKRREGGDF